MTPSASGPEQKARAQIDVALVAAGWIVQDRDEINLSAGRGVAVREFKLTTGFGFADLPACVRFSKRTSPLTTVE